MPGDLHIKFELANGEAYNRFFPIITESITDFKPIWNALADDFRYTETNIFDRSGAFEGLPAFAQLSTKYKLWKDRHYPGRPILTLKGDLRDSVTNKSSPDHIEIVDQTGLTIGTKDKKARYHQFGTAKMPARPFMLLSQAQKTRWNKIIHTTIWNSLTDAERTAMQRGQYPGRR